MSSFVSEVKRTHRCGELSQQNVGEKVVLMGWVDGRRDHGGLVFIDLRDRSGIVQVVINPADEANKVAKDIRGEFVIAIQGEVRARPENMVNKNIATGAIEVEAQRCEVLSIAETLPFRPDDEKVSENLRLKFRYLDLRSPRLQKNLQRRHDIVLAVRNRLSELGFWEIETPILYKSTPEGARDYLVPSRVHQGNFYALPQSPQTLKQLLMISGYDRYFQIARCFRDEDLRADRQPEFTQVDLEMSFVDQEDVMAIAEDMTRYVWKKVKGIDVGEIPRMTYQEAMDQYGSDKPDLRIPWKLKDISAEVKSSSFKVFADAANREDACVKGLFVPGIGDYSRGQIDKLTEKVREAGAKGLVYIKIDSQGKVSSPVGKFFSEDELKNIYRLCGGGDQKNGMALIVGDDHSVACAALNFLRLHLARETGAVDESKDRFLWVTDFPLLEYSPEDKRWAACHHPFTSPSNNDMDAFVSGDEKLLPKVKAKAYDFVCNGYEIAGGSIRIHRQEVQEAMFNALGISPEERKLKFGFFLEALKYGTPPHGGIAFGVDRMAMILCNTEAIREVIAFPKTAKASCLMSEAPSPVAREQLLELGIRLSGLEK